MSLLKILSRDLSFLNHSLSYSEGTHHIDEKYKGVTPNNEDKYSAWMLEFWVWKNEFWDTFNSPLALYNVPGESSDLNLSNLGNFIQKFGKNSPIIRFISNMANLADSFDMDNKITGWEVLARCLIEALKVTTPEDQRVAINDVYDYAIQSGYTNGEALRNSIVELALEIVSDPEDRKFVQKFFEKKDTLIAFLKRHNFEPWDQSPVP